VINVYLDDVRPCPRGFVPARTADECMLLLADCEVDLLSLDFELGYGQPNGLAVVHWLIAAGKYPREIYIHSSSISGKAQMLHALRAAGPDGVVIHDGPMPVHVLEAAARTGNGANG